MFSALEVWITRYLLHWYAWRACKTTVTLLTLPSSHAAELLQVARKSLIGDGILARIWVLAISRARTQVRVHWGTESYQVSAGLHHSLYLWSERSFLFHSAYKVHWWYVFQFFLVLTISWWISPLSKICWVSFFIGSRTSTLFLLSPAVFIYHVKVAGSGHSCLVLSSWEVLWYRCWSAACRKTLLRTWEINLLQHFFVIAED